MTDATPHRALTDADRYRQDIERMKSDFNTASYRSEPPFSAETFVPEAVIIDNGEWPSAEVLRRWTHGNPCLVCCDGAADKTIRAGLTPWLIVGDGDSVSAETRRNYADRFIHFEEQDYNDQTKAVRYLHRVRGMTRFVLLGAVGGREDHALGNISLLPFYKEYGITALLPTENGLFVPCCGRRQFKSEKGQQVSIFRFHATGLRATGLRYPLRDFTMPWQGTLNEALGTAFEISAEGCYLVYLAGAVK